MQSLTSKRYTCGHCGNIVASSLGYFTQPNMQEQIHICPNCNKPTYFDDYGHSLPGVAFGNEVASVPSEIAVLYKEARVCTSAAAYTASVLLSRKLLMNIAVGLGAEAGKPFISYVEYLATSGYVPPNGKGWVDHIRKKGNEATHEIVIMSEHDAQELISFLEMLLKFIYEFPSKIPPSSPAP